MADVIDYGQVKNAAKDAADNLRADINRISSDVQNVSAEVGRHTIILNSLQNTDRSVSALQVQVNDLSSQLATLHSKLDNVTNQLQNVVSRLP